MTFRLEHDQKETWRVIALQSCMQDHQLPHPQFRIASGLQ
jgi:hypothetical protein